jgi:hypothetical protein
MVTGTGRKITARLQIIAEFYKMDVQIRDWLQGGMNEQSV